MESFENGRIQSTGFGKWWKVLEIKGFLQVLESRGKLRKLKDSVYRFWKVMKVLKIEGFIRVMKSRRKFWKLKGLYGIWKAMESFGN